MGKRRCEVMGGPYRHFSQNLDSQLYAKGVRANFHDPSLRSRLYDYGQCYQEGFVGVLSRYRLETVMLKYSLDL